MSEIVHVDNEDNIHSLVPIELKDQPVIASGQAEQSVEPNKQHTDLQQGPGQNDSSAPSTEQEDLSPVPYDRNTNQYVVPAKRNNPQGIDQTLVSIEDSTKQKLVSNEQEHLADTSEEVRKKDSQKANLDAVEMNKIASRQSTEQSVEPNKQHTDLQPGPGQQDTSTASTEQEDLFPVPCNHNINESVVPAVWGNGQGIDQTLVSIEDNTKQPLVPSEQEHLADTTEEVRKKDSQKANLHAVEESKINLESTRGRGPRNPFVHKG